MIFNFNIPTIEDNVNLVGLLKKPGKPEWSNDILDFNEAR